MLGDNDKKWPDDAKSDILELIAQPESNVSSGGTAALDVERTMKSLDGYHEGLLEALRTAATSHRSSGNTPSGSISGEILMKTLQECSLPSYEYKRNSSKNSSKENICDNNQLMSEAVLAANLLHHHRSQQQLHQPQLQHHPHQLVNQDDLVDDHVNVGPLRIRNLNDLIQQLEQHQSRHMSPSGSEDIRMSETEAERHYRLESSAACSESSHG